MTEKNIETAETEQIFYHPDLFVIPENNEAPYLLGYQCNKCSKIWFPKIEQCPSCWDENLKQIHLSRIGKLYSYSVIHIGQKGIKTPYVIGYVDLPENIRIFTQLDIGLAELKLDMEVEVTSGLIRVDHNKKSVISYKFKAV